MKSRCLVLIVLILLCSSCFAEGVKLTWQHDNPDDISGFKIYWGSRSIFDTDTIEYVYGGDIGTKTIITPAGGYSSAIDVGNVYKYSFHDSIASFNDSLYFAVTAYDSANNESGYSNEIFTMDYESEKLEGDFNDDCRVDIEDLNYMIWTCFKENNLDGDFNNDNRVDIIDINYFIWNLFHKQE